MSRQCNRVANLSSAAFRVSALALTLAACQAALAAENGLQRYSPGVGGSDMTSPLVPGWYGQVATVAYHASKLKGNDGKAAASSVNVSGFPVTYESRVKADVVAVLPRLTYLSSNHVLGGNLGFTVMLPVIKRKGDFSVANVNSAVPAITSAATVSLSARADAMDGSVSGIGDVELSPIVHWEIGDHQAVTFAPTLVLPTGDYKADRRLNPGYGNFITFRPSVQYAFIGDGWDLGGRAVLSFNTRNKENGYYSGTMFNLDYQAMAFVSEDVRLGLQGYWVRQIGRDTQDLSGYPAAQQAALAATTDLSTGNKASVVAAGPAVAWLKNGGEFMLEGKFLKEYKAHNRTEGQAFWLTLSKPL
ncbi:transporter [Aquabacterium sp.]|uniref:SphA family protein n=1 Tax=Aquabacterium sp. TaxID=1872578 RepID=UPI0025C0A237|nr:transporter [Aquabacterium sp.]